MLKRYPCVAISTACIPWKDDYSFDEETFSKTIRTQIAQNLKAIYGTVE